MKYLIITVGLVLLMNIDFISSQNFKPKANEFNAFGPVQKDLTKTKTHSCLMVIAWLFFASTGIFIARYFKYIFPKKNVCGVPVWLLLHRIIMVLVAMMSFTGFMVILAQLNWKWARQDQKIEFAHSILGIIAVGLSIIQVFFGFFRCDKDSGCHFIFNFFNKSVAIISFLCAIASMYLGAVLKDMKLGEVGWGLLLGWSIWVLIFPIVLEFIEVNFQLKKERAYNVVGTDTTDAKLNMNNKKTFLMILHLLVITAFTVALVVMIAIK